MKFYVTLFLMVSSLSAPAQVSKKLTLQQKMDACNLVLDIVPVEGGRTLNISECLEFEFEIVDQNSEITEISMFGQTVEDVTTVCSVYLPGEDLGTDIPESYCELE